MADKAALQPNESPEWVNREGQNRLYPALTDPNWHVLRRRRELFRPWISKLPASGLRVLDIGGRIQPYCQLLGDRVIGYCALDPHRSPLVNLQATGEQLPFRDDLFDLVICTQVLEYVGRPDRLIMEVHRVLRPGGYLFLSAPAVFQRDSDQDLWRFTSAGMAWLLSQFREVKIEPEGGTIIGMGRTLGLYTTFAKPALLRRLLGLTVVPAINLGTAALDAILATSNDQFTANHSAFARK